ncbi:purine/pyrimidine permease [Dermabacteraceae bacterium TAE3-ERU5]|nr:purine/pyrimidine permease [Dermabacteraceae bacterium TAE3-ERU5]
MTAASSPVTASTPVHPVDQVPPAGRLTVLSFQHVLAFYAGAVVVPLLISAGLKLTPEQTIHLINADLFTCGIATLIQSVGFWKVGVRLPIIQGVTTTAISPIIAIGLAVTGGEGGVESLPAIYGSIIIAGLFTFFAAPYFAKFLKFFPPVVIGTVLTTMGITLLGVSANDITNYAEGVPASKDLLYAGFTLAIIILMQRFFRGFLGTISILVGLVIGTGVAFAFGDTSFDKVVTADWVGVTTPFYFGLPQFTLTGAISMIVVMLITMVETTGDVFAAGEIVGKRITKKHVSAALRADGLSTTLGGVLNSFPYTCFAQNVGLVRLTRVRSRWVVAGAGVIMIILGLLPKAGAVVASIPSPVLGAASLALFANVALVGVQTLTKVDLRDNRNAVIVTISLGLAMLVSFEPGVAGVFPAWAQVIFASGVTMGSLTAIVLNLLFFHVGRQSGMDIATDAAGKRLGLAQVNAMDRDTFVDTFAPLFNNVTWPLEIAHESAPFNDVHELRSAIQGAVLTASPDKQRALINDYPDMAELLLADEERAAEIASDAGSLALDQMDDAEQEQLSELAQRYRDRFGMPFVACLGRMDSRQQIISGGVRRLDNSPEQEHVVALTEVVEIANDRFAIMIADANPVGSAWARKFEQLA